jgi:hypothetical protein
VVLIWLWDGSSHSQMKVALQLDLAQTAVQQLGNREIMLLDMLPRLPR